MTLTSSCFRTFAIRSVESNTKHAQIWELEPAFCCQQEYLTGATKFSEVELESARSSLIFEIIEEEKTVWDTAQESILSYLRGVVHTYNKYVAQPVMYVSAVCLCIVSQLKTWDSRSVGRQGSLCSHFPTLVREGVRQSFVKTQLLFFNSRNLVG